ncbi:serrate RNA effector molecule isoform X1 [Selaginella moellendorffii]|nr:serrate RNA effector molecule isoform X1 [Selaginella moellendorffii]|eukprot:XP_002968914.2 serrate RNA effector molecule isoform X1 [Selaginella moellendorffii]
MADVMDLPPEPLPRDTAERRKGGAADDAGDSKRRGEDESRQASRHDKHNKRRKSLSPPPLPHRDRRHSPSRRSPAAHKRSRRDDDRGGYEGGRDGILGRGYGGDYGRHRSNEWSGRSMYGDAYPRRDGLLSYKQFIVELEDDILPAEAERRYEEYKAEYVSTQKRAYFEQHKEEDWLREKYDPSRLDSLMARRIETAKSSARDFILELQAGSLDMTAAAAAAGSRSTADVETDDDKRMGGRQADTIPRAQHASSDLKRVAIDIEQAQALVKKLDTEKGVEGNILFSSEQQNLSSETGGPIVIVRGANQVKGLEGIELLDVMLTYLWRVHGLDYYGMMELRELPKGFRHLRGEEKAGDDNARAEWEKKLDSTWQARLQGQDPVEAMLGKDKSEASMSEALEPYVRKIRDEKYGWKYGCLATGCSKLFHGPEFVHKHLKLKHPEIVNESMAKLRRELYYQNYMSDPNAPGVASVQANQRDSRLHRRRPGLLGNSDRSRGRGEDVDKSPAGDYPYEGAGPASSEQPMFDPFGGTNIHGGAFGSEIPPPVLMPVPGAGPLGPFVPAPPDVTMRMWREHGGGPQPFHPAPFDPSFDGGDRGRKGRGVLETPQMVPPVRHDPRHMRSYHDLDAPEDDVTVIDYRSI